jgi:3-hydroxyacyl-[acyl-carrier-protein] dehydratase
MDTLTLNTSEALDKPASLAAATPPQSQPAPLCSEPNTKAAPTTSMDIQQILDSIPHRYPFLLVDRVVEFEKGVRIKAIKNVTMNEPHFQGHFPGLPIMPGVLQVEALAQTGAVLVRDMLSEEEAKNKLAVLAGLNNFRFRRMVKPGDQLVMVGELVKFRPPVGKADCKAYVDGELVLSGELVFSLLDRDSLE